MSKSIHVGPNPRLVSGGGGGGAVVPPGYTLVSLDGMNNYTIDLVNGNVPIGSCFVILLTSATADTSTPPNTIATIKPPVWTGGTITTGCNFFLFVEEDSSGGWPMPNLSNSAGGFTTKSYTKAASELDGSGGGCTCIQFTKHGSLWALSNITPGVSLS